MRYFTLFLLYQIFKMWCEFYTYNISQFGLATFQMLYCIPTSSTLYGLLQGNNRNVWIYLWLEILVSEIGKAGFLSSGSHIGPLHWVGEDQVKCIFFSALGWDSTQMDWSVHQGLCVPVPLAPGCHWDPLRNENGEGIWNKGCLQ